MLAVAGTVGAASAALASGPVKNTDQKAINSASNVVKAPVAKGPEFKLEHPKYFNKGPEIISPLPNLRGPGPANGTCLTAEAVAIPSSTFGDTTGGVPDPEGGVTCTTAAGAGSPGVWYTFTGNGSNIRVETCGGAAWDTVLRAFSGSCGALTCVIGNDDNCGLQSGIDFLAVAGTQYYIYLSGFGTASGQFTLNIIDNGMPPPGPANDDCAGAQTILCNSTTIADNTSATVGPDDITSCRFGGGNGFGSIWYKFTATDTSARLQTCSSVFPADDSIIEVFAGGCGGLVSIGCSEDDCNGLLSRLDLNGLTVGQEYTVCLSGWGTGDLGAYTLDLTCPLPPMQPGDVCATALPLPALPASVTGDTSTFEVDTGLPACGVGAASPSIWYSMVGTGGIIRATTCNGTSYDSALAIFTGDCAFPTCVANNDDSCGLQSTVTFPSNAGQTYYIVVRGFGSSSGAFTLDVEDLGPPGPGDNCATAQALAVPGTVIGNTCSATPEALFCGVGDASAGLWYSVVGTGNNFIATTCNGTTYDSALSVLSGTCDFLTCVASNDDACGLQSTVVFPTVAGETLYIVVRGFSSQCGDFTLDVAELLPPGNDECVNATAIVCNSSNVADNLGATDNFADDVYLCRVGGGNGSGSIWFSFTATDDSAVVSTCNSFFPADDSILQVFEGSCGGLIPLADGCNDDGCSGLLSRAIIRNLTVGNTYYIMLSGWSPADAGSYTLDLTCPAPPPAPGDDCPAALDFGPVPGSVNGDTTTANPDSVDTCGGPGAAAPGVWYTVTAPAAATRLRASTCGSGYDTVLRAYNGPCEALSCIAFNDDRCGLQSELIWDVVGGQQYYVYVGGFGSSSGTFTLVIDEPPPPCQVDPTGTTPEPEPDCGVPVDTVNGGCNSVPPIFGTINCNQPIFGSAAFDGFTRDTDWFHFVMTEPGEVTFTVQSEFASLIGFLETNTPNPTGVCSEYTGFVNPFAFPNGDCLEVSVTATLGAGTWGAFVAPQFLDTFACGTGNNEYRATLSGACGGEDPDCNGNGIPDPQEIAGGARDCFNPVVVTNPHTAGGADTFLDECQCVANWNRDGSTNSNDISAYLTSWLNAIGGGPASADVNCDNATNSNDISGFLTYWLSAVQNTVPHDGCP